MPRTWKDMGSKIIADVGSRFFTSKTKKAHYGVDLKENSRPYSSGCPAFHRQRPRARARPAGTARPGRCQRHPGRGGQGGPVVRAAAGAGEEALGQGSLAVRRTDLRLPAAGSERGRYRPAAVEPHR